MGEALSWSVWYACGSLHSDQLIHSLSLVEEDVNEQQLIVKLFDAINFALEHPQESFSLNDVPSSGKSIPVEVLSGLLDILPSPELKLLTLIEQSRRQSGTPPEFSEIPSPARLVQLINSISGISSISGVEGRT